MSNDFYKDLSDLCKIDPQAVTIAGLNTNLIGAQKNKYGGEATIGVDTNNEPAMMTRSKKGITEVWEKIRSEFSASWTWSNATKPIEDAGIKTHYWCRVD